MGFNSGFKALRMHSTVPSLCHESSWRGGCLIASEAFCCTLTSAITEGLDTLLKWKYWLVFFATKHAFWERSSTAKPNPIHLRNGPLPLLLPFAIRWIDCNIVEWRERTKRVRFYENVPIFIYKGAVAQITISQLIGYELYLHPYVLEKRCFWPKRSVICIYWWYGFYLWGVCNWYHLFSVTSSVFLFYNTFWKESFARCHLPQQFWSTTPLSFNP